MLSQLEEEMPTITHMSALELAAERQRLIDELVSSAMPLDAFERVAILEICKADPDNLLASRLIEIEKALHQSGTQSPTAYTRQDEAKPAHNNPKPTPALVSFLKTLFRQGANRKQRD